MTSRLPPILLVEDSPDDRIAVVRALRKAGCKNPVFECGDGDQALDYLRRQGPFADALRPAVVLLDLNMPRVDGLTVLQQVKNDADLRAIPVIVLTTSCAPQDIASSYAAGANSYVQKPVGPNGFTATMSRLVAFWFGAAVLPEG